MPSKSIPPDPRNWVLHHADALYAYALARLDDQHQARDLVQDTFLFALGQLDRFEGRSSERTWLTAILKYRIIDVYRKKNSALANPLPIENADPDRDFFEPSNGHWKEIYAPQPMDLQHADPLIRKELADILKKCMQQLPQLWRSVFIMKHMEDEKTEAICTGLKITPSNFWVIIHRAKLNLRACIQKSW
jgi:RNA polymerase sigma-70 factor (ECF subfamily)